ncbi:MAG: helix-turn-helix domain-containing protein [Planctomycetes bacterium]|nr:helix-turn-helix domain-containing protein [Planctomycetota bacterium]
MPKQETHPPHRIPSAAAIMLTIDGVAAMLACSPRTVYRLVDAGRIPRPVRLGGMIRWPREPFERWIGQGCPPPKERKSPPCHAPKSL